MLIDWQKMVELKLRLLQTMPSGIKAAEIGSITKSYSVLRNVN